MCRQSIRNHLKNMFYVLLPYAVLAASGASAASFYVDAVNGDDASNGRNAKQAWKTISRVNAEGFAAGDTVYFSRGQRWREMLAPISSGAPGKPIVFTAYGEGKNPIILRTELFDSWTAYADSPETGTIWQGSVAEVRNTWGGANLLPAGGRVTTYRQCLTPDQVPGLVLEPDRNCKVLNDPTEFAMEDEHFYAPLNSGRFYYRHDAGNPGAMEIGARRHGIYLSGVRHVVVNGIDVFGPGGMDHNGGSQASAGIKIDNGSKHIVVKNLSLSSSDIHGITSEPGTENIIYDNLDVFGNKGTGIYMKSTGGEVINSRSHDNGRLSKDIGDRGGIGVLRAANVLVQNNEVYRNGQDASDADFEISIVLGHGPTTVTGNYVHDCLQGCIQVAQLNHGSVVENNTVEGFGEALTEAFASAGKFAGIRIGASGGYGTQFVTVRGNHITGGARSRGQTHAAIFLSPDDLSGIAVTGNVFDNDISSDIYVHSGAVTTNGVIDSNTYHVLDEAANWVWKGEPLQSFCDWVSTTGFDQNSSVQPYMSECGM